MPDGKQLLAEYVATGSEPAFRELVTRYVDLVYSAAVRLVNGDTHLAEDITQTVFADLARSAGKLSRDVMLGGWLHRHTCFVASNTLRSQRRREARERQVVEMNSIEDHSASNLASVAPILDEAINQLGAEDRTAIMLRFFEQSDFQAVGQAMGSTEEAARKRVNRALDKLEVFLKGRGVALSATALATTMATHAVTAAPAGFALNVSAAALATAAAGGGSTALTVLKLMSVTKLKIGIVGVIITAAVAIPWVMQHQAQTQLTEATDALHQQSEENSRLAVENDRLSKLVAATPPPPPASNDTSREVLKLRGEVGRLRQENAEQAAKTNGPSPLSGLTATPEVRKLIRDQQKMGMTMIYGDFTNRMHLSPEQSAKFTDLLADDIMENIDHITAVLADGKSPEEREKLFAAQDAALQEKIRALLGPEGLTQYQDYTRNLGSYLTSEQFKGMLSGEKAEKEAKSKQLYQAMQEETQQALTSAGLAADFQTVPMLNFRNIASETEAEKNLALLEGIYAGVTTRASAFLSPEEMSKFESFRTNAINTSRMALTMNRKMMAPTGK